MLDVPFSTEGAEKPDMAGNAHDLGLVLQKARTSRGFIQADVASQLGVSRATIAQIETGRRSLKAEELLGETR